MEEDSRFEHHCETINGLSYHFVTCGTGPAVLFCHGFPDLWRSWRRQMSALANRGYRAIAPDMRGFGGSQGPSVPTAYTCIDLVGDMLGILDHLGISQVVIVGHDWGATIAWCASLLRPDRFVAVAALSVPYTPRGPASLPDLLRQTAPADLYMLYFLEPGKADAELDADPATFLRRIFYSNSASLPDGRVPTMRLAANGRLTDALDEPPGEMPWFDEEELSIYVEAFTRTGFTPALNTYRSLRRSWELMAAWNDRTVSTPALYIGGDRDIVLHFPGMKDLVDAFVQIVPGGKPPIILENAGHFIHLERPGEVNALLLDFLGSVSGFQS